jgi:hypothetical protein
VSGIVLCLMNDDDITQCQCFRDLTLTETKERVRQILVSAMSDWSNPIVIRRTASSARIEFGRKVLLVVADGCVYATYRTDRVAISLMCDFA